MSVVHTALPESDSPLWRIGLYHCKRVARLQVGNRLAAKDTAERLDNLLLLAGFSVIRSAIRRRAPSAQGDFDTYSKESEHGYTHKVSIGQSSIVFHTYPEWGTVTISIETCGDLAYCRNAMHKLVDSSKLFFGAVEFIVVEAPALPLVYRK